MERQCSLEKEFQSPHLVSLVMVVMGVPVLENTENKNFKIMNLKKIKLHSSVVHYLVEIDYLAFLPYYFEQNLDSLVVDFGVGSLGHFVDHLDRPGFDQAFDLVEFPLDYPYFLASHFDLECFGFVQAFHLVVVLNE